MKNDYLLCIITIAILLHLPVTIAAEENTTDSIVSRFNKQLQLFPQEKLYMQTDKPYYTGGEDLWFRIYLTDYISHIPDTTSRYVYTELVDPLNRIMKRIKTIPRDGAYYGQIHLDETLPEGSYLLRCYTRYMEGLGDEYLYRKKIYLGSPLSALYRTHATFNFDSEKNKVQISLTCRDVKTNSLIVPKEVRYMDKKETLHVLKASEDSVIRFNLNPEKELPNRILYIEYEQGSNFHSQFISVPYPETDYDVTFLPEGGNFPADAQSRIAFKALKPAGLGEYIEGSVVDSTGTVRTTFRSNPLGMGSFSLRARAGERLQAVCKNKNRIERKFDLPVATSDVLTLQAQWTKNILNLFITTDSDKPVPPDLYLILHCRGILLHCYPWDSNRKYFQASSQDLPSGIIQALLVDKELTPVSERLIFNENKNDQIRLSMQTDRSSYGSRELIRPEIILEDTEHNLKEGCFSLSVTNDGDILPDTSNTILTTFLLTSELKGYIERPEWYFSEATPHRLFELDQLMLTQGWSRYHTENILKGKPDYPTGQLELGPAISGTVAGGIGYTLKKGGYQVSITSLVPPFYETTETDENGRFCFTHTEMPEGTRFLAQALTKKEKGKWTLELTLDSINYPEIRHFIPKDYAQNRPEIESYIQSADDRYTKEHGIRTIALDEVVVKARKKGKSPISVEDSKKITLKQIEEKSAPTLYVLLKSAGGLNVTHDRITWALGGGEPVILIDEIIFDNMDFIIGMDKTLVEEIEIVKPGSFGIQQLVSKYGSELMAGAIIITSKARDGGFPQRKHTNKKSIIPLGYQEAKEFYSPRYETEEDSKKVPFDLRTTVYWNPDIKTKEGKATFDFYSADAPGTYSVTLEGISNEGKLIRETHKINIHE